MNNCDSHNKFSFSLEEIRQAARTNRLLSLEIEPTLRCNYKCPYCYAFTNAVPPDELSFEELSDVVQQASQLGARKIVILGGEPLLYSKIFELIDRINSLGMIVELFSNGALLTAEKASRLYAANVNLVLKLNSFKPDIQAALTGNPNALKQAMEALGNAKNAGYPGKNAFLAVSTIICSSNIDEMETLWRYLRDNNITPYFEIITPQGKAAESTWLQPPIQKIKEVFSKLSAIDREYGHVWEPRPPLVGDRCLRHLYSCLVTSTGLVFPCVGINEPVGNIRQKSLSHIIQASEIIQDLRSHTDTIKDPCGSCAHNTECYGCRGTAYQLTGDWLAADPLCWHNQHLIDDIHFLPVDAGKFIPQQPPMQIIDSLLTVGEKTATAAVTISPSHILVDSAGCLADTAYLEMMAQTVAADDGFRSSGPSQGMLIGVRNFIINDRAKVGDQLRISIYKDTKFNNWGVVKGQVSRNDVIIAEAELKVWKET